MTEIRVTLVALKAAREAIHSYYRDMADSIAAFKSSVVPTGTWCDEDATDFEHSAQVLLHTVVDLSNAELELSKRLEKKEELVRENKTYRV